jgi:hypothetical protein
VGGARADPALRELATSGRSGFVRTVTLDKVASLTYLSPPGPHGWATVLALPEQTLTDAAWQIAVRAVAASALLLVIGLGLAILAARRISRPVKALERNAGELLVQRIPPPARAPGSGKTCCRRACSRPARRRARPRPACSTRASTRRSAG